MKQEDIDEVLDSVRFNDRITIIRTNRGDLTSAVTGPALAAPPSKAVAIDLLDGAPHIIRDEDGQTFGTIESIYVQRQVGNR